MLKISPFKTIALATALTVGTAGAAQNRLQDSHKQFVTSEFRKADTNPQDYFISQNELNTYMGNNNVNVKDFDITGDNQLNIDEFGSIISGHPLKTAQQQNKNSTVTAPKKTTTAQSQKIQQEAKDIADKIKYYEKYYYSSASVPNCSNVDVYNTAKRINVDNFIYVAKYLNAHNDGTLADKVILYKYRDNGPKSGVYEQKCYYATPILDHLGNVYIEYFKKHPEKNTPHNRSLINDINKSSNLWLRARLGSLDKAYECIMQ